MNALKISWYILIILIFSSCSNEEILYELDTTKIEEENTYKRVISIKGKKVFLLDYLDPLAASLRAGKLVEKYNDVLKFELNKTSSILLKTGDPINLKRSVKHGKYSLSKNENESYVLKRIDGEKDILKEGPFVLKSELSEREYEILEKLKR